MFLSKIKKYAVIATIALGIFGTSITSYAANAVADPNGRMSDIPGVSFASENGDSDPTLFPTSETSGVTFTTDHGGVTGDWGSVAWERSRAFFEQREYWNFVFYAKI